MKSTILFLFLYVFIAQSAFTQEEELLLKIDEPWRSEQLTFPIAFAPSLDYKGIEEVRFAKGWGTPDSEEFWTYTFLWYLDEDPSVTATRLEKDIEAYFNGLMALVGKGNGLTDIPNANVVFVPENSNEGSYIGKAKIFDAFFTKDIQTLHIKAVSGFCEETNKYTVLFTFSPKTFDHSIWKTLNGITLTVACE
ncbi:hypothetical protein [uncultured Dokdonia sp.]|uniref:hypothetical protein n=1 Tax=uncultured Dokdonia sp. TaxID=575653 RepID=UPI0026095D89|nr:hypothetical protein [uncultured Dokdonia sp.]